MDKDARYRALVENRKKCDRCPCMANASEIDDGRFDSDRIGPYSRWQGNLNAELMVVAQDFADVAGFSKHEGWPGERVETNRRLVERITEAGITLQPPRRGVPDDRLFFTNAVLCMKEGGMRSPLAPSCVKECGRHFLRPLIELVSPRIVVTLGRPAAAATCLAFGHSPPANLADPLSQPIPLTPSTRLLPLYHLMASRSREAQRADWQRVRHELNEPTGVRLTEQPVTPP